MTAQSHDPPLGGRGDGRPPDQRHRHRLDRPECVPGRTSPTSQIASRWPAYSPRGSVQFSSTACRLRSGAGSRTDLVAWAE